MKFRYLGYVLTALIAGSASANSTNLELRFSGQITKTKNVDGYGVQKFKFQDSASTTEIICGLVRANGVSTISISRKANYSFATGFEFGGSLSFDGYVRNCLETMQELVRNTGVTILNNKAVDYVALKINSAGDDQQAVADAAVTAVTAVTAVPK